MSDEMEEAVRLARSDLMVMGDGEHVTLDGRDAVKICRALLAAHAQIERMRGVVEAAQAYVNAPDAHLDAEGAHVDPPRDRYDALLTAIAAMHDKGQP